MSQVLTVRSESLAAGFATRDDYTRTTECDRRLPLNERAPDVPFKLGLLLCEDVSFVHREDSLPESLTQLRRPQYIFHPIVGGRALVLTLMEIRSVKRLKNSPADREGAEMKNLLKILWRQQEGQDLTEYALLLALLALGAITSIGTLAKMINNIFANAASNIGTATGP